MKVIGGKRVLNRTFMHSWELLVEPHTVVNGIEPNVIEWAETGPDCSCVCVCM